MKQTWKLTDEQKAEIADRYAAGEKMDAISASFDVANGSVIWIARSHGHPPRRPARPRSARGA